jgi:DNA-directed RNA polymerase subunit RPC12/RpoP
MAEKTEDGYIRWRCKSCGQKLKVKESYEGGNVINCPRCWATVTVPLSNIDAIAEGSELEETGEPGRIKIDRDKLMSVLEEREERAREPGSAGSTPSVQSVSWDLEAAFGRVRELDQFVSTVRKIDQEVVGEIQRLYRNPDLQPETRYRRIREAARGRLEEIKDLLQHRLGALAVKLDRLEGRHQTKARDTDIQKTELAIEALKLYTRFVLGIKVEG